MSLEEIAILGAFVTLYVAAPAVYGAALFGQPFEYGIRYLSAKAKGEPTTYENTYPKLTVGLHDKLFDGNF